MAALVVFLATLNQGLPHAPAYDMCAASQFVHARMCSARRLSAALFIAGQRERCPHPLPARLLARSRACMRTHIRPYTHHTCCRLDRKRSCALELGQNPVLGAIVARSLAPRAPLVIAHLGNSRYFDALLGRADPGVPRASRKSEERHCRRALRTCHRRDWRAWASSIWPVVSRRRCLAQGVCPMQSAAIADQRRKGDDCNATAHLTSASSVSHTAISTHLCISRQHGNSAETTPRCVRKQSRIDEDRNSARIQHRPKRHES